MMAMGGLTLWLILISMVIGIWLWSRSDRLREQTGLPDGNVIYTDTGTWFQNNEVLHAKSLNLVGKPDYLVEQEDGVVIPVELKSGRAPESPREGHILQLAAYCLLVEENFGTRPDFGILQYKDKAFAVDYSEDLEEELLDVLSEMRESMFEGEIDRDHNDWGRCARCGVRRYCHQRLA